MLSFKPLALLFALGAAAFTSAAPVASPIADLAVRCDTCDLPTLPDVLTTCHNDLTPLVAQIRK